MGGISIWSIVVILVLVVLLFGTSKLRNVGSDLGSALKGFKKAMAEDEEKPSKDADFEPLEKPQATNKQDLNQESVQSETPNEKQSSKE